MTIKPCSQNQIPEILEIFNWAIASTTALYDYDPRSLEAVTQWYEIRQKQNIPVLGCLDDNEKLLGFSTYGEFRHYEGYKFTAEHSLYVHPDFHRKGIGEMLLKSIAQQAFSSGIRTLVGVIDADNEASIRLHEKLGFERCGKITKAGYKFERWLDIVFYQIGN